MNDNSDKRPKILLAEDESTLAMIISETLTEEGFDVDVAVDGAQAIEMYRREEYSMVITDVMMPKLDGFELVRRLKVINSDIPIIFLTAKSDINDLVKGLDAGGDDYMAKPFRMLELVVRIRALLRRYKPDAMSEVDSVVKIGKFNFNFSTQTIEAGGTKQQLTHFENELLRILIHWKGRTVSYAELMEGLWHHDDSYNRASLHGFIFKLRSYLAKDPEIHLVNNRGVGYKLIAP